MQKEKESKNVVQLRSFVMYCLEHPEQRFWQCVRNWAGVPFILKAWDFKKNKYLDITDTFNE